RVALLPYLGEGDLYRQFRLDEPWDGSHNQALLRRMPAIYAPVGPLIMTSDVFPQLRLEEPLDSPSNQAVWRKLPSLETPAVRQAKEFYVKSYQVFHGPRAAFEGESGLRMLDFSDGTSNTFLIVEAAQAVPWTKPADLPYSPLQEVAKLGSV